jgi:dihydropteroate synthase
MSIALEPLRTPEFTWDWGQRTFIMGIINVTPDSFSGDGLAGRLDSIVALARDMVDAGADMIDVGGESTRPGHVPITAEEELKRVIPAIEALAPAIDIPISIDTSKALVADAALRAGARIVNDIRGFTYDPEVAQVAARAGAPVIIMHDRKINDADGLIPDITRELCRRIDHALAGGVPWEHIIIDPGFGFGKTPRLNLVLLRRMRELIAIGRPILAGTSRKSMIGHVLGTDPQDRIEGTAATVALAIANGADIVRVHDVAAMARVARMTDAIVRVR